MKKFVLLLGLIFLQGCTMLGLKPEQESLNWSSLADLPPAKGQSLQPGLAGAYIGVTNGVLVVAGGANFPEAPPWEGGKKIWHDDAFVLRNPGGNWEQVKGFPKPMGYGINVQTEQGIVCIAGNNDGTNYQDVFRMNLSSKGELVIENLPSLPDNISKMCGDGIDNKLYIACGKVDGKLSKNFYTLDLNKKDGDKGYGWEKLPEYPGKVRTQAVGVCQRVNGVPHFFVLSGMSYPDDVEDAWVSTDGLVYNIETQQWKSISKIGKTPRAVCSGSAVPFGKNKIIVTGGRGSQNLAWILKILRHRGKAKEAEDDVEYARLDKFVQGYFTDTKFEFNDDVLVYDAAKDSWSTLGKFPGRPAVTAESLWWNDSLILPSGEIQPGIRTPKVWSGTPE